MTKLSFHRRPMPIFADYRPLYRMAKFLLVLYLSSRGGKSSIIRLQLFNWVLKDDLRRKMLSKAADDGSLDISVWGLDPSLNSAIQFSLAEGLVERCSNGVSLTDLGKSYIKDLIDREIFKDDVEFLKEIGKDITETMVSQTSDSWG